MTAVVWFFKYIVKYGFKQSWPGQLHLIRVEQQQARPGDKASEDRQKTLGFIIQPGDRVA